MGTTDCSSSSETKSLVDMIPDLETSVRSKGRYSELPDMISKFRRNLEKAELSDGAHTQGDETSTSSKRRDAKDEDKQDLNDEVDFVLDMKVDPFFGANKRGRKPRKEKKPISVQTVVPLP